MRIEALNLIYKMRSTLLQEDGQDLIEYALVVALIAFAAVAGMQSVATAINGAFTAIGTTMTQYTA
jgi:pilus assembly protein Flp/PilA